MLALPYFTPSNPAPLLATIGPRAGHFPAALTGCRGVSIGPRGMSDQAQKKPTRPSDMLEPVRAGKGLSVAGSWTEYLVLFLRLMAAVSLVKGLYHWALSRYPQAATKLSEEAFRTESRARLLEMLLEVSRETFPKVGQDAIDVKLEEAMHGTALSEPEDAVS